MKIGFVILKDTGAYRFPFAIEYTWDAIVRHKNREDVIIPSREWYALIKALSYNQLFISEIEKARATCGLPSNGLSLAIKQYAEPELNSPKAVNQYFKGLATRVDWEHRYCSQKLVFKKVHGMEIPRPGMITDKKLSKICQEADRIKCGFDCPISAEDLKDIIQHGFVNPRVEEDIVLYCTGDDERGIVEAVHIEIRHPVSKNAVRNFVNKRRHDIERLAGRIRRRLPGDFSNISDRDFHIVDLHRTQARSYPQIADQLENIYSPDEKYARKARFNEDSARAAYNRAIDKINAIFKVKSALLTPAAIHRPTAKRKRT